MAETVAQRAAYDLEMRTRRERIATAVLAGFAASPEEDLRNDGCIAPDEAAERAVRWADALIAELDK